MNEAYDHLIDSLNMRGGSVTAHKCDEIYALLQEIFTPDEALLFSKMPFGLATPEQIAQEAGKTPEETGIILEEMANKGLITSRDREGKMVYAALPLVPGIFEFQLMKGGRRSRTGSWLACSRITSSLRGICPVVRVKSRLFLLPG